MGRILTPVAARGAGGLPAPPPWLTVTLVLSLGFGGLLSGHLIAPEPDVPLAVIVPPWRPVGMAFAAEVGLPPIDIRWGGRLVVFPPSSDRQSLDRMGPFVMSADGSVGCLFQRFEPETGR